MDKLHWKSATDIAHLIREKKVSASEVLEHFLEASICCPPHGGLAETRRIPSLVLPFHMS
jgi:hypothetical protein